jgi:hypothetical protein
MEKAVKNRLENPKSLEVSKGANGGFKVIHRFDNMEGGYQPPQEHNFGPEKQGRDVLRHLKEQLGLGKTPMSKNPAQKKAASTMPVVPPEVM